MVINNLSINDLTYTSISNTSIIPEGGHLFILILSILSTVVLLVGFIGNVLVISVVLNYGALKTVTNTYLLHLAVADLIFLTGIPFFISSIITRSWIFGSFVCKMFFLSQGVNQYTSIIILGLLSFDRYLAVCHPPKSITWHSRVNPNMLLMLTWIFSFLMILPIILFTTLQETGSDEAQCTIILPLSQSPTLYFLYVVYTSTITFFIPISCMIYFHVKIIHQLQYRIPKQHRRSQTSMRTRRKVTILVLTVISVHLICCFPYWTFQMFTTSGLLPQTSEILISTATITQFLLFVNSSTNPMLYAFISEIFRASFKRFCSCFSTGNSNQPLRETPLIQSNTVSTINRNPSPRPKTTSTIIINNDIQKADSPQNQYLSVSTQQMNIHLLSGRKRLSFFISEASYASDV